MSGNGVGKKRKGYYKGGPNFKRKRFNLSAGLRGFLCTCSGPSKDCVKEAYNILNEYADKLYDPEVSITIKLIGRLAMFICIYFVCLRQI